MWRLFLVVGLCILGLTAYAADAPRTYVGIITDVSPQVVRGRTYVPIRFIAEQFGAEVRWLPASREVMITRPGQPNISMRIGSPTAYVGNTPVAFDAAPFISGRRTLVPLRFIAETYRIPVAFHAPTRSIHLTRDQRIYVLPLMDTRTGIMLYDPHPGQPMTSPLLVQGQANVFEGALVVEVLDKTGRIIGQGTATAGMGAFYPFNTQVAYILPGSAAGQGTVVVYAEDVSGRGGRLAEARVTVQLSPSIP